MAFQVRIVRRLLIAAQFVDHRGTRFISRMQYLEKSRKYSSPQLSLRNGNGDSFDPEVIKRLFFIIMGKKL